MNEFWTLHFGCLEECTIRQTKRYKEKKGKKEIHIRLWMRTGRKTRNFDVASHVKLVLKEMRVVATLDPVRTKMQTT